MATLGDQFCYNDLPYLGQASVKSHELGVDDIVSGPMRDVFLKHAMQDLFCLYVQHRHHTVSAHEAIVKVNGTAHRMDSEAIKRIASFGNKVIPTTWMTNNGKVLPMEYAVVPNSESQPEPTAAFLADFLTVLAEYSCEGLFGLDTLAKTNWSELTVGDASVVVPSVDEGCYDEDEFIPVAFSFDKDKPGFKVHGRCGTDHTHTRPAR